MRARRDTAAGLLTLDVDGTPAGEVAITTTGVVTSDGPLKGDRVAWNTSQGETTGKVVKRLTGATDIKGHHVAATADDPQLLVESDSSGERAAHKPEALRRRG